MQAICSDDRVPQPVVRLRSPRPERSRRAETVARQHLPWYSAAPHEQDARQAGVISVC
jgi:hypothetical protein